MNLKPFCCDITSGTPEEQNEFKEMYKKASYYDGWSFAKKFYCIDDKGKFFSANFLSNIAFILPLSEGIALLKQIIAEEQKMRFFFYSLVVHTKTYTAYENHFISDVAIPPFSKLASMASGKHTEEGTIVVLSICELNEADYNILSTNHY